PCCSTGRAGPSPRSTRCCPYPRHAEHAPPTPPDTSMAIVRNPVLKGFHPDPSILRVGDDYYIATSTFEWYPGVAISHSRDLVHWRTLPPPLTRRSQLDL